MNSLAPLLTRIYKKTFWNIYDHIGLLLILNLLWFLIFPLPTYLCFRYLPLTTAARIATTLAVGFLTQAFAMSGIFGVAAALVAYREAHLRDFFTNARSFFSRTLALGLLFGTIFFLLFVSIRFYVGIKVAHGILGFFLAGIQVWILAFSLLMQTYLLPLLFIKNWDIKRVIKWSAMLVVLRPGLTILMFLQALAIFTIITITGVGLALLTIAVISVFLNTTLRETLKDMEATWTPKQKPTSWKEIFAERDRGAEERRTLKDLFRPWEH